VRIEGIGHTILYRARSDSPVNRYNISLLKRVVDKSTTPIALDIYYHEPIKLSDWAEPHNRTRYIRLRSDLDFPIAEKIVQATSPIVIVLNDNLLLAAGDIWQLLGRSRDEAMTTCTVRRSAKNRSESVISFLLREASLHFSEYSFGKYKTCADMMAINKPLAGIAFNIKSESFAAKKTYVDLLSEIPLSMPAAFSARSRYVESANRRAFMGTWLSCIAAFRFWHRVKRLPDWFSERLLLFLVAQIAVYYAVLVALVSWRASLIVFAFAFLITPGILFRGMNWLSWRMPGRLAARMALYLTG
jgi:hypothetical protein